jgi:predicted nuclease of predicted toxin-antitoxin system
MKLKLDENLPTEVAELLIDHGHDVHTIPGEALIGHEDAVVFEVACARTDDVDPGS